MDKPFAAYRGTDPYVFVCYAHRNADRVYKDLAALHESGINFWYDEGIPAGTAWRAEIASAISGAAKFIFFVSSHSVQSKHCLNEVDYALNNDVDILPVFLDDQPLPGELGLALNRVQALYRERDSRYLEHLLSALRGEAGVGASRDRPARSRFKHRVLAVTAVVALALASLLVWQQTTTEPQGASTPRSSADADADTDTDTDTDTGAESAFDRYLSGLALMERWDKGDNLDQALALFSQAATIDPSFALAFARMGEVQRIKYALTRDDAWLDKATKSVEQAYRLDPELAPVQVAFGRLQSTRGNTDLAVAALEKAVDIDPNDAIANQSLAAIYARLGRRDDAETLYKRALALDPDNLFVLDDYANYLFRQSRYDEAATYWQRMIRLAPDHYVALVNLGSALNESGKVPEAIAAYEKAIAIRPTYIAYSSLATANGRAKRYPEAVAALKKALEIEDSDWEGWGNLGYAYSWMGGMEAQSKAAFNRAIELAEEARKRNSRDPDVNSYLALYYAKTGQPELAIQRLETAVSLSPDAAAIQAAAAETYELLGRRDHAVRSAKQALKLGFPRQVLGRNPDLSELLADPRMQAAL
ncbi:MAG: tetratricopeptide repeat protein [Pseudomonadales bacterium]